MGHSIQAACATDAATARVGRDAPCTSRQSRVAEEAPAAQGFILFVSYLRSHPPPIHEHVQGHRAPLSPNGTSGL